MIEHLYAHIPFCPKICPYCSFYKEASDRNKTQAFLDAMLLEAKRMASELRPQTIFFGGGTPTALSTPQLRYLLERLRRLLDLSQLREWTIEMNPATVSMEKARMIREYGINRISMGVQSWDPAVLRTLGRVHTAEQAEKSFRILRDAGFDNINLDFIFAVPGQSLESWRDTLARTVDLQPDHISAYSLTFEEDTDFFLRHTRGELIRSEETDIAMFDLTMQFLEEAGYAQYEISNYAKPGRECLHNIAYWSGKDYVGLGPSAVSTVGSKRWTNIPDTAEYTRRITAGLPAHDTPEIIDNDTRASERRIFGLRMNRGVPEEWLAGKHTEVETLSRQGLLEHQNHRVRLTRKGRFVADAVAEAVL